MCATFSTLSGSGVVYTHYYNIFIRPICYLALGKIYYFCLGKFKRVNGYSKRDFRGDLRASV